MTESLSHWWAAVSALGLGAVAGLWSVFASRRDAETDGDDAALHDAEERADHLITTLRDLEEQSARLDPAMYAAEKARFEQAAAQALRARDHLIKKAEGKPVSKKATPGGATGFIWGALSAGFVALLFWLVNAEATPRTEGAPPAPMQASTNNEAPPTHPGGFSPDDEMVRMAERLQKDPKDIEALVLLGHRFLRAQMMDEADVATRRALELDPNHAEAQVHAAALHSAQGDQQAALATLDRVTEKNPQLAEAWFFRGMIGMQSGNTELAQSSWRKFVEIAPDGPQKDRIRGFLAGEGLQMPR